MLTPLVYLHPLSVLEDFHPLHTNGKVLYLPVASNSAMFLIMGLNFLGSNDQKQSVVRRCSNKFLPTPSLSQRTSTA